MAEKHIVSYSELSTFRQCPLKHHLMYAQRWTRPPKEDGALARGSLWHRVLEVHYTVLRDTQGAATRATLSTEQRLELAARATSPLLIDPQTGEQSTVQEQVAWMYQGHVAHYGVDPQWRILAIEHPIQVPLPTPAGRASRFILKAKLDLVVFDYETGQRWVIDHKSGKDLPKDEELQLDDQFGLYTWAMAKIGKPVQGSIHSGARTYRTKAPQPLGERFRRTYLNRSAAELTNLALDAYHVARAAYPPAGAPRALYSNPDPRQCGWRCEAKEAHLLMRQGIPEADAMSDYDFHIDRTRH